MDSITLTILTPTYNREDRLPKLYESLKSQTNQNFQWLVIDDGSTDNTSKLLDSFTDSQFLYEHYWKPNGGKHTALNFSHPYIRGKLVCIVDSDDWLMPNAVSDIYSIYSQFVDNKRIKCYIFQRGERADVPINKGFKDGIVLSNDIDYRVNSKYSGDGCEVIFSDIFKSYPFPEHKGEKFLGEGYLWQHIGFNYDTVYINKVIYICEYLEGGLTRSGRIMRIKCPLGGMDNSNSYFEKVPGRNVKARILFKEAILFDCYGFFAKMDIVKIVKVCRSPVWAMIAAPFGYALYLYWNKKYLK